MCCVWPFLLRVILFLQPLLDHGLHEAEFALHRHWLPVLYLLQGASYRLQGILSTSCNTGSVQYLPGGIVRQSCPRHEVRPEQFVSYLWWIPFACLATNILYCAVSRICMASGCMSHSNSWRPWKNNRDRQNLKCSKDRLPKESSYQNECQRHLMSALTIARR